MYIPKTYSILDDHGHPSKERRDIIFVHTRYQGERRLGCILAAPHQGYCCLNLVSLEEDGWHLTTCATFTCSSEHVLALQEGRGVMSGGTYYHPLKPEENPVSVYHRNQANLAHQHAKKELLQWILEGCGSNPKRLVRILRVLEREAAELEKLGHPEDAQQYGEKVQAYRQHIGQNRREFPQVSAF